MKPDYDHDHDHDNRADWEEEPFYPEVDIPTSNVLIAGGVLLFLVACTIGFFVLLTRW